MKEKRINITHIDSTDIKVLLTQVEKENKSSTVFIRRDIFLEPKREELENKLKELQAEFPSLTLCYEDNIMPVLKIIASNCSTCKHYVIHHNYLINAFENNYDMYSYLVGFATALDIEIEIIKN